MTRRAALAEHGFGCVDHDEAGDDEKQIHAGSADFHTRQWADPSGGVIEKHAEGSDASQYLD